MTFAIMAIIGLIALLTAFQTGREYGRREHQDCARTPTKENTCP